MDFRTLRLTAAVLGAFLGLFGTASAALADASPLFKQLAGSWHGLGDLTLADGTRERISCRGYYVLKSGGNALSIAILCNSPNQKVEIRSLVEQSGRGVSGQWEERTFNATGQVSSRATTTSMRLSISGTIEGAIAISLKGRSHSVTISAAGTGFKGVSMSLFRG
jgi:hypothetical protein